MVVTVIEVSFLLRETVRATACVGERGGGRWLVFGRGGLTGKVQNSQEDDYRLSSGKYSKGLVTPSSPTSKTRKTLPWSRLGIKNKTSSFSVS